MIPRFTPTFGYSDLFQSLKIENQKVAQEKLRSSFAGLYKARHIFFFNSARVALYALLKAYARPGAVLMPAYNCLTVPEAVSFAGYSPVFVDVDSASLNMTAETLEKSLSEETSVVLATHIFGIPCDIEEIIRRLRRRDVLIVEDAAPALGAEFRKRLVGSFGDATIISFQSIKVISGETGGVLLTNRDELADRVADVLNMAVDAEAPFKTFVKAFARKMATRRRTYSFLHRGYRVLYDEQMYKVISPRTKIPVHFLRTCSHFSSALVLRQMGRLGWNLSRRRKIAQIYQSGLADIPGLRLPDILEDCSPAWIQFPVSVDDKMAFYRHMQRYHVDVTWTYRYSCADSYGWNGFPNAKRAAQTVLGLPTYPSLSDDQARYICEVAQKYAGSSR